MQETNKELQELDNSIKDLISTPLGRREFLLGMPLLLTAVGCSSGDKKRYREGDNSGQKSHLSVEDEKRMTAQYLPQMEKDYPKLNDSRLQSYVNSIGQKIVRANNLHGKPYKYDFTVVGVGYVNAFALPAGTVFVTAPLIAMADTEAELAGVIGHEIGHIKARHTAERMYLAKQEEGNALKYGGIGSLVGAVAGAGLGTVACKGKKGKKYNECLAKATAAGAVVGAAAGLLIQKYKFMANSREDEMEADRIGFRTSVNAGYSKAHVGKFYEKLLQMEKRSKGKTSPIVESLSDAMSTHPPSEDRVEQMNEMVGESRVSGKIVSTSQFDRMKKISKDWARRNPPKRS
ncbi:MAG: M48 family metalloprotease [Spirochaetota bacterium]